MLIRVSDSTLVPGLLAALDERPHYVAAQVGPNTVTVIVLGSFAEAEDELRRFLGAWHAAYPEATVELLDE
jgi:hypothetical protein